jgi:hypothetical protein
VRSDPAGIDCRALGGGGLTGACRAEFSPGSRVTLTAAADPGSGFAGFNGACTGTSCQLTLGEGQEVEVRATFNVVTTGWRRLPGATDVAALGLIQRASTAWSAAVYGAERAQSASQPALK